MCEACHYLDAGSIHCDAGARRSGMNGEGVHNGAVLVTYTHFLNNVMDQAR